MTKEQQYFLSIIKNYIHGEKTENNETVDWTQIFDYSRSHQLTAIVFCQCKNIIPNSVADDFKKIWLSTVATNVRRKDITEKILVALQEKKVSWFLIKGPVIANYYPMWQYRTMGDTDIVVDDLEKAHSVLLENGFENLSKVENREYQYSINGMEYELHDRLVFEEAINLDKTTDFLNHYHSYVSDNKLDDSFHFIYVLTHLRKHFMNSGVGLRQFVDLAVLIKNNNQLNWQWIEGRLEEIGLLPFTKTVFYYLEQWFSVTAPIDPKAVSNEVYESSTDYIFANGVFGFDNDDNNDFLASNTVRKSKYPKLAMIKSALQKMFPSYKTMIASKKYQFLNRKPFFLPFGWFYRIFREIRKRGLNSARKQISKSFVPKEFISKREEMFRNWGG